MADATQRREPEAAELPPIPQTPERPIPDTGSLAQHLTLPANGILLDEQAVRQSTALPYVLMIASLLERRIVTQEQLLHALRKRMRQRSIQQLARRDYVLDYLNLHPP